ncbi:Spy/CpxP family protein refolding chaperone [Microvirga mediterraneensis]|uniref:Spy/CpxP family protein refolding chaperone n=1 Tax=Microvirga mediterraneensis TaxID=2754695 RepID=A0A838BHM5_9HYPH|nr:Spy/CpxP family protein refolding chaperone [Microvirga mediterraneensis]MBA1154619.1 Spy/CpxP family protein refolding chaperone [Microvirga mediterraneensis]
MKTSILTATLITLAGPALAQATAPAPHQTPPAQAVEQSPMNRMPMRKMGQDMMQGQGMMPGGMMGGPGHGMMGRFSAEDMSAFIDAHIAAMHAGLKLSADQEKLWPPVETALRNLATLHVSHMQAMRQARGMMASDPVGLLRAMADRMSQGADAMRKLTDAASPLYATLDEAQKRRLQVLMHMGGRGMMGPGMMGREMMGPGGAMMPGGSDDDDD